MFLYNDLGGPQVYWKDITLQRDILTLSVPNKNHSKSYLISNNYKICSLNGLKREGMKIVTLFIMDLERDSIIIC